jgi:ABC-2 type transport system permease protein
MEKYRYSLILLKELVRTDFKVRYQNSVLGYLWSLLRPLFMFIVLYIIFVRFLKIGRDVEYWPVALFLGLVMWEFFSEITKQGLKAVVGKGSMIRKINFPKYIIIISSSLSALINLALNLVVVAIFVVIVDAPVTWSALMIPIFIFQLYVFGLGLAFILSTIYVKFRDINFVWEIVMRAGFYASAVMFPLSRISEEGSKLLVLSPVSQTIEDARHSLLGNIPPASSFFDNPVFILIPVGISILTLVFGALFFRKKSKTFAENV